MNELRPKVSIIGCGNVGIRYAYSLMISGLARSIVLIDRDRKRAEGEAMDLSHGAPYSAPVEITAGDYADTKDSDLVVITAGKKQLPGQTRIDLVKDNIGVYKTLIPEIIKHAPSAILLIVSNPVDILSYAAYKISGKPSNEVIGSGTVLDSARLRFLIAKHCRIDPHNVHAYVLGEHGDTEFPVWSKAMIGGMILKEYCPFCEWNKTCNHEQELRNIFTEVRDSAYRIIERKGETSYGIGLALTRITRAVLRDENAVLPVSSLIAGYYRLNDVYLSIPAVVNRKGVREQLKAELNEEEQKALLASADSLKNVIAQCGL
ncbi:MAG: L-lactate dehydrogenase [Elusimicrobiota bacterium]